MKTLDIGSSPIASSPAHPLLLLAAASVTVLSLAGVGVLAGWLPGPTNHNAAPAQMSAAPATAPISIEPYVSSPQRKPTLASKSSERAPVSASRAMPASAGTNRPVAAAPAPTYPAASRESAYPVAAAAPVRCNECGVVETVHEVSVEPKGSGGGAIAGGLVGGLIANQIGKGATRDIATVLGAIGGAYAGNHIEKSVKESKRYDVVVRFEDGSKRTFSSDSAPAWHNGDRVRLQNGALTMGGGGSNGIAGTI